MNQPWRSFRASCGAWFACARTATPACERTCSCERFAVSDATSTSLIVPRAAVMFVDIDCKFETESCKRFIAEPKPSRIVLSDWFAASIAVIAACAFANEVTSVPVNAERG